MPPRRAARNSPPVNVRPNALFTSDNLYVLNGMNSGSVDLIYLDPPFNSKRTYEAPIGSRAAGTSFKDIWTWQDVDEAYLERMVDNYPYLVQFIQSVEILHSKAMMAYLTYMTQRIIEMRRVLKPTGCLYLHVDPVASHYLKIVLDRIFGQRNFRNEVIWLYEGRELRKTSYNSKHDMCVCACVRVCVCVFSALLRRYPRVTQYNKNLYIPEFSWKVCPQTSLKLV